MATVSVSALIVNGAFRCHLLPFIELFIAIIIGIIYYQILLIGVIEMRLLSKDLGLWNLNRVYWNGYENFGYRFVIITTCGHDGKEVKSTSIRSDFEMNTHKSKLINIGFKLDWNAFDDCVAYFKNHKCAAELLK